MIAAKSQSAIGFLTTIEHAEYGLFGGYLILNAAGRPLEFHCTAPVKANRAQEILYGPTLREYLHEQIAPALLAKAKATPEIVCTDSAVMLHSVPDAAVPLVLIAASDTAEDPAANDTVQLSLGTNRARLPLARAGEQAKVQERFQQLQAGQLDLLEPFARIREALEEAQRAAAGKVAA